MLTVFRSVKTKSQKINEKQAAQKIELFPRNVTRNRAAIEVKIKKNIFKKQIKRREKRRKTKENNPKPWTLKVAVRSLPPPPSPAS